MIAEDNRHIIWIMIMIMIMKTGRRMKEVAGQTQAENCAGRQLRSVRTQHQQQQQVLGRNGSDGFLSAVDRGGKQSSTSGRGERSGPPDCSL